MRVLTSDEMRAVDRRAIDEIGVPGMVLMENAALGVVDALADHFPTAERVVVVCGPGNNGGDGLAVARQLATRGYDVEVVLASAAARFGGDAATQLAIVRRLELALVELPLVELSGVGDDQDALADVLDLLAGCDLVVDALYGTGLSRPLAGRDASLVELMNSCGRPILAVDLPSGLDASSAMPIGPHVVASLTVTFAAPKVAQVLAPACHACGELVVADLGVPSWLVDETASGGTTGAPELHLLVAEELASLLPTRSTAAHKGSCGHALVIAGGPGTAGAAILAGRAAVRGGAGLVTLAVPAPLALGVDCASLESLTLALPANSSGHLAADPEVSEQVLAAAANREAVACGPGLGAGDGTTLLVEALLDHCAAPLVLDADALNVLAGRLDRVKERLAPTILTPHPGELGRLLGISAADVQANRLAAVTAAARSSGAVVVLKGERTLIAAVDRELGATPESVVVWVNPTGNPALATGGSGDVLTGLLVALLAQGLDPLAAARLAVYAHGLAGDHLASEHGPRGLAASDLAAALPQALAEVAAA